MGSEAEGSGQLVGAMVVLAGWHLPASHARPLSAKVSKAFRLSFSLSTSQML